MDGGVKDDFVGEPPIIILPIRALPVPGLVPSIPILFLASRIVTLPEELRGEFYDDRVIPIICEVAGEFWPLPGRLLLPLYSTMTKPESED